MPRITVYPEGSKTGVILTDNNHIATGGEASVYMKDKRVFKLYKEPHKAVARGLDRKLTLLKALAHPGIAAPDGLVLDKAGGLIGLTMPFVAGEALCKLYTNTWRDANRFGFKETGSIVDRMREVVIAAHGANAVMVDANELNWIADGTQPIAIDVDSWQLPGFPATVVMPSIMDHGHPGRFDAGTDWFAWAVVTYQLWTGIHPYKGTHPIHGRGNLELRMKAMASVFDAGVRLPPSARDAGQIPPKLLSWYEATFQSKERRAPPKSTDSTVAPQAVPKLRVLQSQAGTLKLELLRTFSAKVVASINGFIVLRDEKGSLQLWDAVHRKDVPMSFVPSHGLEKVLRGQGTVLRRPAATLLLNVDTEGTQKVLRSTDLGSGVSTILAIKGDKVWQAHNRAFVVVHEDPNGLHEIDIAHVGSTGSERLLCGVGRRWPLNALSSTFLRNVVIQDAFGTPILGVATPQGFEQATCPALRGHRVIDGFAADARNVWLTVRRMRDGELVRVRLSLKADRAVIDHEDIVAEPDIEAAMTDAGVAILRMGDEILATRGVARKTVSCAGLSATLRVFGAGAGIFGFEGSQVATLKLAVSAL